MERIVVIHFLHPALMVPPPSLKCHDQVSKQVICQRFSGEERNVQVIASVTSCREQMMQYMVLIVHQLAEQRVVGVVNQFSHRQLIDRTEP